jgi:hypothetical protein
LLSGSVGSGCGIREGFGVRHTMDCLAAASSGRPLKEIIKPNEYMFVNYPRDFFLMGECSCVQYASINTINGKQYLFIEIID